MKKCLLVMIMLIQGLTCQSLYAEVIDRIVATVNDEVILLSELEEAIAETDHLGGEQSPWDVLNEMIESILILSEAKKYRMGFMKHHFASGAEGSRIIEEYLKRRVKAFVHIPFEMVDDYYQENREQFPGRSLSEARDEIEDLLAEKEYSVRTAAHLQELRNNASIRIQLNK